MKSLKSKGLQTIFGVLLLIVAVVICILVLTNFVVNWVSTQLEKIDTVEFCQIHVIASKYIANSKTLELIVNTVPYSCKVNIYVIKDNNIKCSIEKVEISKPYTKVEVKNCQLTRGTYKIEFYTLNNILVGKTEITINS